MINRILHPIAYRRHMKAVRAPWPEAPTRPAIHPCFARPLPTPMAASEWGPEASKVEANS